MKELIVAAALIASGGTFAADTNKPGATFGRKVENTFRDWSLEELPAKVQKAVRAQAFGHKIKDIDREDRTGRTIWEIRFDGGPKGEARKVHIDNDGNVLNGDGQKIASGSSGKRESASASSPPPPKGSPEGQTEKIKRKWEDVPEAVKKASAKYGSKDYVRDIDVEKRDGIMVWELEFSREGQNIELHFAEDGRILEHIDSGNKQAPQQLK
jgi:uncharacterized membrane protein YkoI